MKEILIFKDVAVYSDKDVKQVDGERVDFVDGSVANLEDLAIRNIGKGNIEFRIVEELIDTTIRKTIGIDSSYIEFIGGKLNIEIVESEDNDARLEIIGTEDYSNTIGIYDLSTGIRVETPRETGNVVVGNVIINGKRQPNKADGLIKIYTTSKSSLYFENNGGGKVKINTSVGKLKSKITGSLDIDAKSIDELDVTITGSGSINVMKVINSANIKITGSGNVHIDEGELSNLKVSISGSGHVKADVVVEYAELQLSGSGNIQVEHVMKESIELHQGSGSVKVYKRG